METQRQKRFLRRGHSNLVRAALATGLALALASGYVTYVQAQAGRAPNPEATPQDVEAGQKLYQKWCQGCHGSKGKGDGPASPHLEPRPRDFTTGLYKIRFTASGELPKDEDILRAIAQGMPGTSMPGWPKLSERERRQLVAYIKTFSPGFASGAPIAEVTIGKPVSPSRESLAQGQELYRKLKCWECHGEAGRGDGPSTPTLTDDWGFPIRAANLTQGWTFRGGSSTPDIYRTFTTGMNGTPMPSYIDSTTEEERWHLANFVKSLSPEAEPKIEVVLTAKAVKGQLPKGPDDPAWDKAKAFYYPLWGQIVVEPRWFNASIRSVGVRALYNEQDIAFLVSWDDSTQSIAQRGGNTLSDAMAVQFPSKIPTAQERPYFLMGEPRNPVNLWYWKAGSPSLEELEASGQDKLNPQRGASQVNGQALFHEGQWKLMLKRPLSTEDKESRIQFEVGKFIPIAITVWDGSRGEVGSKRAISSWYFLLLEKPTPLSQYFPIPLGIALAVGLELWLVRKVRRSSPRTG